MVNKQLQKHVKKLIIFTVFIFVVLGIHYSGIGEFLTLERLQANKDMLQENVANNYLGFAVAFILIYIVAVAFSLPGATIMTLAAGLLFGAVVGTVYVNIGATLGATLAFLVSRFLLGNWVQRKYEKQLKRFNEELQRNGKSYMLTLRFIPIFPFFLINLFAGVTKIPVKTFMWTTSIGIIPGSFVYAYAGQQLNTVNSLKDVVSFEILSAFVLLGLLSLVPVFYKKIQRVRKGEKLF